MLQPKTKVMAATFIGTVFLWLEYSSYTALLPIIAALFYPFNAPAAYQFGTTSTTLFTYGLLPLGALCFGALGDTYGRKTTLSTAIFLVGITSLFIGYLPTYSQIGIIAPILLLFLRLIQSIAFAGGLAGASLFLVEQRRNGCPHFLASWVPLASGIGLLFAFALTQSLDHPLLMSWGWRIPFFLSAVSCIVATYLYFVSRETPTFIRNAHRQRHVISPIISLCKHYKLPFLNAFLIASFIVVYIDICTIHYYSTLLTFLHLSHFTALSLVLFQIIFFLILLPIIAFIADKTVARSIVLMGLLGCTLSAPLLFASAPSESLFISLSVESFFAFFTASALTPLFRFQISLFPTSVRYTGLSLAWALSLSILAAPTLQLAQHIMNLTHWLVLPAAFASISALLTFILMFAIYPRKDSKRGFRTPLEINTGNTL